MQKYILIICSFLLALPLFISKNIIAEDSYDGKEKFDISLSGYKNISSLENYIDSMTLSKKINVPSTQYALLAEDIISRRFYHGYSHFTLKENWIAAILEKISGIGLSAKVQPDDIMTSRNAACSQQAIIMMEILKNKKIPYRKIGLPHHYVLEANINNDWLYLDPDMEPEAVDSLRKRSHWKSDVHQIKNFYPGKKSLAEYRFGDNNHVEIGPINENPAGRIKIFQNVTAFLSYTFWIFPLLFLFIKRSSKL